MYICNAILNLSCPSPLRFFPYYLHRFVTLLTHIWKQLESLRALFVYVCLLVKKQIRRNINNWHRTEWNVKAFILLWLIALFYKIKAQNKSWTEKVTLVAPWNTRALSLCLSVTLYLVWLFTIWILPHRTQMVMIVSDNNSLWEWPSLFLPDRKNCVGPCSATCYVPCS